MLSAENRAFGMLLSAVPGGKIGAARPHAGAVRAAGGSGRGTSVVVVKFLRRTEFSRSDDDGLRWIITGENKKKKNREMMNDDVWMVMNNQNSKKNANVMEQ